MKGGWPMSESNSTDFFAAQADSDPIEYRSIPGFPDYRVGNDGIVWRNRKMVGNTKKAGFQWVQCEWKIKIPILTKTCKYYAVKFRNNGKYKVYLVHRLVLESFVGPCPEGMEACHNDGDVLNNRLSNLRWDTRQSNQFDRYKHGTDQCGEKNASSKLTRDQVLEIVSSPEPIKYFVQKFKISDTQVRRIKKGQRWKTVIAEKDKP
jgi:hypothetical protein